MNTSLLLCAISSEEPSSFNEVCRALGDDCPEKGDRDGWRELMQLIGALERTELIEVDRRDGRIETLILTSIGKERVQEIQRANR